MTKIMLVEDDNNLREIYEARLSAEGYDIVAAPNGEAALAIASKEHPDMIISDVMMPKISGFEMLDILRNTESLRDVKIIMLTALGQAEDNQRANALGADRYLVKSQVTLEDIVRTTHELLNDASSANLPADADDIPALASTEPAEASPSPQPAPVAEEPANTAPALEPMPAAPRQAVAPAAAPPSGDTDTAGTATVPVVTEPPLAPAADDAAAPASDPSTLASASQPAGEPEAAVAVIAIPVSDSPSDADGDDNASGTTPDDLVVPPESPLDAPLNVVEPPAEAPEPQQNSAIPDETADEPSIPDVIALPEPSAEDTAPADATATSDNEQPAEDISSTPDYTSPDSFNTFQEPGVADTAPAIDTELVESASQDTASEEAAMKAQIDSFISSTPDEIIEPVSEDIPENPADAAEEAPATSEATETIENTEPASPSEPAVAPPSVGIPSIISSPIDTAPGSAPTVIEVTDGSTIDEPQPESLDEFQAPVISSPAETAETTLPEPIYTQVQAQAEAAPETPPDSDASVYDDQLVQDAAEDLAASSTETPDPAPEKTPAESTTGGDAPKPQSTTRMKTLAPISSGVAKPGIHQLLELEEARNAAQQAAGSTQPATPSVNVYKPSAPAAPSGNTPAIDPNSISL